MFSAFTKRPIHHLVNSKDAGAGKNYLLELVSRYFPDKYVFPLGNMTDKAIFHRKGILVINDPVTGEERELAPITDDLNLQIDELKDEIDEERAKEVEDRDKSLIKENKKRIIKIESEIAELRSNAQKVIDLNNQIIMCLDTPKSSLYDAIMSIVSQDTPKDQEYSFVDKNAVGKLTTRNNKIRGTPVIIPTQVVDDSKNERFQEKNRRFVNVNPDTSSKKIHEAKRITALQGGYLPEEYDQLVVSRADKQRARELVEIIVTKLMDHSKYFAPKELGVKIPFALTIHESIPSDQLWAMTVNDRMIKYLSIITKVNMDFRPRVQNTETGQFFPIAITADLKQTLQLMKVAASAVRPYIAAWYNKVFISSIADLDGKPNEQLAIDENGNPRTDLNGNPVVFIKEKSVGVNTEQLALKHKQVLHKKPGDGEILYKYLYPLRSQGVVNSDKSEIDRRENIWSPVEEGTALFNLFSEDTTTDYDSDSDSDSNLKLKVSSPDVFPGKNFLKEQFRTFVNYRTDDGGIFEKKYSSENKYKLLDVDGSEVTLEQLIDKYYNDIEDCFTKDYDINLLNAADERQKDDKNKKIFEKNDQVVYDNLTQIDKKRTEESFDGHSSATVEQGQEHKHNSYFSFGKWRCNDCNTTGDRFHMENTECKNNGKGVKR